MDRIGKFIILTGLVLVGIGLLILAGYRAGFFRLPGDFAFSGKNWKFYFPLATCLLLSLLLTGLLWLVQWFRR